MSTNPHLEAGGWYLVRHPNRAYGVRQITAPNGRPLVGTCSIRVSPFPHEINALYFGGLWCQ